MSKKPTFIDLFAGAGGMSEGFIKAVFSRDCLQNTTLRWKKLP